MFNNLDENTRKQLGYLLSLPERSLRSLAAVTGGTTLLFTDILLPQVAKDSIIYNAVIGDFQRFMVHSLAQMEYQRLDRGTFREINGDYPFRKVAGTAIEMVGLLSVHFSPLWVFAIVGDAATGSRVYLNRLVAQLKENGVIAEDTAVTSIETLFIAMQDASKSSVTVIDTPPLTRVELDKITADLRTNYGRMFSGTTNLVGRIDTLWTQIETVAEEQDSSISEVEGVMTLDLAGWGKKGVGTVTAVGQTTGGLIGEHILDSYAATLNGISTIGLPAYVSNHMNPFLHKAANHFDPKSSSWTEDNLLKTRPASRDASPPPLEQP